MKITRTSLFTGKERTKEIAVTQEQLDRMEAGELIQHVCPDLSEDDREFIISGITPEEWEENYGEDDFKIKGTNVDLNEEEEPAF